MRDNRWIDERSLAFGRAIASQLKSHPELLARGRATLERWMTTCWPGVRPALEEWRAAIDGPPEGLLAILTGDVERAVRLRQSNPFAGVLSQHERNDILQAIRSS